MAAIASRDAAKAKSFADQYGIERSYGAYEALLADPAIDAIYIPLPNHLHAEWAISAMAAGKHVLCEKPLAITGDQALRMFEAAKRYGVHLVEAYPYRAQSQTHKVEELLASGVIGRVKLIRASFGVRFSDPENIRLRPDTAGGALLDAGSYAMNFIRMVSGERPARVSALADWAATGVDRTMIANIEFKSGSLAQLSCSFATGFHRHAIIAGDDGVIETTFLNHPPVAGPSVVYLKKGIEFDAGYEIIATAEGNGFLAEADSFAKLINFGPDHWTGSSKQESIDTIISLEAILQSARSGKAVSIA